MCACILKIKWKECITIAKWWWWTVLILILIKDCIECKKRKNTI